MFKISTIFKIAENIKQFTQPKGECTGGLQGGKFRTGRVFKMLAGMGRIIAGAEPFITLTVIGTAIVSRNWQNNVLEMNNEPT